MLDFFKKILFTVVILLIGYFTIVIRNTIIMTRLQQKAESTYALYKNNYKVDVENGNLHLEIFKLNEKTIIKVKGIKDGHYIEYTEYMDDKESFKLANVAGKKIVYNTEKKDEFPFEKVLSTTFWKNLPLASKLNLKTLKNEFGEKAFRITINDDEYVFDGKTGLKVSSVKVPNKNYCSYTFTFNLTTSQDVEKPSKEGYEEVKK